MSTAPVIAAFDISSVTGVCWGHVGQRKPTLASWDLSEYSRPWRFAYFMTYTEQLIEKARPAQIWYEEPLKLAGMMRINTSDHAITLLRGMVGIIEALAINAEIEVHSFSVQAARRHLLGQRAPKGEGKQLVMRALKVIGIEAADDHQADAACGWLLCSAQLNPRIAHLSAPLFAK